MDTLNGSSLLRFCPEDRNFFACLISGSDRSCSCNSMKSIRNIPPIGWVYRVEIFVESGNTRDFFNIYSMKSRTLGVVSTYLVSGPRSAPQAPITASLSTSLRALTISSLCCCVQDTSSRVIMLDTGIIIMIKYARKTWRK